MNKRKENLNTSRVQGTFEEAEHEGVRNVWPAGLRIDAPGRGSGPSRGRKSKVTRSVNEWHKELAEKATNGRELVLLGCWKRKGKSAKAKLWLRDLTVYTRTCRSGNVAL